MKNRIALCLVWVATTLVSGCDNTDFNFNFLGTTTHAPYSIRLDNDETIAIDPNPQNSPQIGNIDFDNEGHGWIVMNITLTNGSKAVFHTNRKVRDAEDLLNSESEYISPNDTQQDMGLRVTRTSFETNTTQNERTQQCTYYETRYVCVYDPYTHRNICQNQQFPMTGWQDVTETVTTNRYGLNVDVLNESTPVSSNQMTARVVKRFYNYSQCFGGRYPRPY